MPASPEAAALFYPPSFWLSLAGVILAIQLLTARLLLHPRREQWRRVVPALVLADVVLVALLRGCVAGMGRLDYSEQFTRWRLWFLGAALVLFALPVPAWALALRWAGVGRTSGEERPLIQPLFLTPLVMLLLTAAATFLLGADLTSRPHPARVTRVEAFIPNLSKELDGVRLAVLADLHTGELVTPAAVRTRLRALTKVRADLLLVLGDVTFLDSTYQRPAARALAPYVVPGRSFAVGGNMDSAAGTDTLREELGKVGIRYLENESVRVRIRGREIVLAGLGDVWTGEGDLNKTLAGVPGSATTILLSHSPDIIPEAMVRRVPLVLSGHLHGGQVVLPFAGPAVGMSRFGTRFASGAWRLDKTMLVASRGLGEEGMPLRLFCPPEIVVVTLRAK